MNIRVKFLCGSIPCSVIVLVMGIAHWRVDSAYRYNGLGMRLTHEINVDNDADIDGSDVKTYFAYDERWRVVGTYASPSAAGPTERWVHHAAGLAGTGGSSYIDSVVLRDRDVVHSGTGSSYGGDALEERVYVLQNWRADLVATLGRTGTLIEWIQYTPYGMAVTNPLGNADFKGDGGVDGGDTEAFFLAWEGGLPSADINNDGGVDGADVAAFEDIWESGETPQAGLCMRTAVRVGYAGYQWDGSVNHDRTVSGAMVGLHHVRHRVYEPELGRWTRRDPIGYADGMSLFAYVRNAPILLRDPSGLSPRDCIKCLGTILTYLAACPTAIAACGTGAIPGTQLISWPACLLAAAGCLGSALQGVQSCTVCITYLFPGGMPPTIPAQIKPNPAVPRSTPISPDEPCWGEPLSGDKVIVVEPRETNWPDPCHCAKNYNENLVQCRRCPEGSADRTGCILMVRERFDRCEKICPELLRESAPVLVPH